jgi:GT2 family glycosyltransferase
MNLPVVYVVILNWNGWNDTIKCIDSLKESSYSNIFIVIIDNASSNNSIYQILDHIKNLNNTLLIQNSVNSGFAAGNNIGIKYAIMKKADYIFVLNNDTIIHPDCIQNLVNYAEKNQDSGLFGPKIYDMGSKIYHEWAVRDRFNIFSILVVMTPIRRLIYRTSLYKSFFHVEEEPSSVYAIPGSAMFFRAKIIESIDLFDEYTFLYWEEYIIAEKLLEINSLTKLVPSAIIWHKLSASITKIGARIFIENVRSERYFYQKYLKLPVLSQILINGIRLIAYFFRYITERDYRERIKEFLQIYFRFRA